MAQTISFSEYPYLIWQVRNLPTAQQLNSNYFYHDGSRLYLILKQENSLNVEDDCFTMYLDEWGSWVDGLANFLVTISVKNKNGESCLTQTKEVTTELLENALPVWNVKRSYLISKYDELSSNNVITFICTIGPCDIRGINIQQIVQKENKSIQASISADERDLNMLSDNLLSWFEDRRQTDITLKCGDGNSVSAHKAILSARSEVFAAMFRNNMSEVKNGVVNIADVMPVVMFDFVRYLYSGKIERLSAKTAPLLYAAADKYGVNGLKESCMDFMVTNLSRENIFDRVLLADIHSDTSFTNAIICYISRNDSLLKEKNWLDFWQNEPILAFKLYKSYVKTCSRQND